MMAVFMGVSGATSIGLEIFQVQALIQVKENISNELMAQSQMWDQADRRIAQMLGQPFRQTMLERPVNFYPGVRLGVLEMPWDSFPAIASMADDGTPTAESPRFDEALAAYGVSVYIEAVIRSDEFYKTDKVERIFEEGNVDRRAKRTLEAIVKCIDTDRTLGGVTPGLSDPHVIQTDPFMLDGIEPGEQTKSRVFSLVRAEYVVDNYPSHRE